MSLPIQNNSLMFGSSAINESATVLLESIFDQYKITEKDFEKPEVLRDKLLKIVENEEDPKVINAILNYGTVFVIGGIAGAVTYATGLAILPALVGMAAAIIISSPNRQATLGNYIGKIDKKIDKLQKQMKDADKEEKDEIKKRIDLLEKAKDKIKASKTELERLELKAATSVTKDGKMSRKYLITRSLTMNL